MNDLIRRAVAALEGCDPSAGASYEDAVRAVIRAMRDPTDAMENAGAFCEPFLTQPGERFTPGRIIAHACYTAMIDAALAKSGEQA